MQIDIHIVAADPGELRACLSSLLFAVTPATVVEKDASAAGGGAEPPKEAPDLGAAPKRRGRPPRPQTDQPVTDIKINGDPVADDSPANSMLSVATPASPAATPSAQPTVDEVRNAIKALMAATDENTTYELIKTFGAKSASTLHEAGKGAEFIAAAEAAVAAKKVAT